MRCYVVGLGVVNKGSSRGNLGLSGTWRQMSYSAANGLGCYPSCFVAPGLYVRVS